MLLALVAVCAILISPLLPVAAVIRSDYRQANVRDQIRSDFLSTAEVVIDLARHGVTQYAVFLRSFGVLREWLKSREAQKTVLVDRYEHQIVDGIRYGAMIPVVALTDPGLQDVPVIGACRFSLKSETVWEDFVVKVLKTATIIVVHVTEISPGLRLEIKMIKDYGLMPRTVFILGNLPSVAEGFATTDLIAEGAKVLPSTVFKPAGIADFISAVEDIKSSSIKTRIVKRSRLSRGQLLEGRER